MKKVFLIIAIAFISCSKDEEPKTVITKSDLLGTFYLSSASFEGNTLQMTDCRSEQNIRFTETSLFITGSYEDNGCRIYTYEFEYSLSDRTLSIQDGTNDPIYYSGKVIDKNKVEITTRYDGSTSVDTFNR